ncbi:MAG: phage tail sheath subtilisin-like domain-containing protein [Proteobacteria bacterium]|nr:phage tail sheath subtilisin-like domain-containing protein [Pseudomonadota bacterium]
MNPTYPGVYIQEIPSSVRTIAGAATSVAAFIGRALRGPVNEPVPIASFGDFERIFGGMWVMSSLGYAVRDFFVNGGGQAVVVRLFNHGSTEIEASEISVGHTDNPLVLKPASPGAWAAQLRVRIDDLDDEIAQGIADRYSLDKTTLFTLRVRDLGTGREEIHQNLTIVSDHARSADRILASQSTLLRCVRMPADATESFDKTPMPQGTNPWWQSESTSARPSPEPSDGKSLTSNDLIGPGKQGAKEGLYALDRAGIFNLLCIPPYKHAEGNDPVVWHHVAAYCEQKRAMLIIDPDPSWNSAAQVKTDQLPTSSNAAVFFPALKQANPLRENQIETFAPCGAIAGVIARTDGTRGIWKAPAGLDATVKGTSGLSVSLTDAEIGQLNPRGINCLRTSPASGRVIWGARTTEGDDRLASEWKYLPVRRLALFIEESLYRGTQWAVFEPNDEPLWSQLRLNIGTFMHGLFRQGAFQGNTPRTAYFVQCDKETTRQSDIDQGIVNIVVGFAPLKPAEFVIIKLQQIAGQSAA